MAKSSTSGQGRPKGTPNKATTQAREAIAMFVDNNAHRLQEWLDDIASGVKGPNGEYLVVPDPLKAFQAFQSVIEYHIPKLARTENTTEITGAAANIKVTFVKPDDRD